MTPFLSSSIFGESLPSGVSQPDLRRRTEERSRSIFPGQKKHPAVDASALSPLSRLQKNTQALPHPPVKKREGEKEHGQPPILFHHLDSGGGAAVRREGGKVGEICEPRRPSPSSSSSRIAGGFLKGGGDTNLALSGETKSEQKDFPLLSFLDAACIVRERRKKVFPFVRRVPPPSPLLLIARGN